MSKKGLWVDRNTFVSFSEKQTTASLSDQIATRDRSIDFYSLGMYLPNPDPVLKKMGKDIKVYTELLSDPHVGGCVTSRKAGVNKLLWDIDRGKAKSRQAKFVTDAVKALDVKRIIGEILNSVLFGYQPLEVLWTKGEYVPADVVGKPQRWFVYDEQNEPRFLTKANPMLGEALPLRKFLFARHEATYDNPYGFAELSRCFWPCTFKKGGFKFWVKFCEKFGMPFMWGKLPRGLAQKEYDDLADQLADMVQDAIAVTPDDASIEMLTIEGKASGDIYKGLIQECKTEISVALLGHSGSALSTPGKLGGEDQAGELRSDRVDDDKGIVEQTMNQLIDWIAFYNFSERVELPRFIMYEEEDVDSALAERDKTLSETNQIKFTKKYLVKAYGFEEDDIIVNEEMPTGGTPSPGILPPSPSGRGAGGEGEFAEGDPSRDSRVFADQAALDEAVKKLDPAVLKKQMEGVLKPVITLIENSGSYDEIRAGITEAYPDMNSALIEEMIARAIFVSELWGRVNAR